MPMETQPQSQAVARRPASAVDTVRAHLESPRFLEQVKMAMPSGEDGRRLVRGAITAMQKNPSLAECNQASIFTSLLTCAQLGLILDGREAHLVKYGPDCVLIPDYKGIVRLVMQSGSVEHVHADIVCDADEFEFNMGEVTVHRINLRAPRGEPYAVYALARFRGGGTKAEVLSVEEVERIRSRSRQKEGGPWSKDWAEMAKKTAFKRLAKWLPLQSVAREALDATILEEDPDNTVPVTEPPKPALRARKSPPTVDTTISEAKPPAPEPEPEGTPPPPAPAPEPDPAPAPAAPRVPRGRKPAAQPAVQPSLSEHPIGAWAVENNISLSRFVEAAVEYGALPEPDSGNVKTWSDLPEDVASWWNESKEALAAALKSEA